jgi:hypothetical protein
MGTITLLASCCGVASCFGGAALLQEEKLAINKKGMRNLIMVQYN